MPADAGIATKTRFDLEQHESIPIRVYWREFAGKKESPS